MISFVDPAEGKSISFVTLCVCVCETVRVHEMEGKLRATGADRLLAIDPWGRGVLSKETLTRRGEDILPALHFSFRLILSQGEWSHEQGRSTCICVHKHEHTSVYTLGCGLSQTLPYAVTHTHTHTW